MANGILPEDASFSGTSFTELQQNGRYAPYPKESEEVIVGQTVIHRYSKVPEVTIEGLAGSTEGPALRSAEGTTATLVWHQGSQSAKLSKCEIVKVVAFNVYEVKMTFKL